LKKKRYIIFFYCFISLLIVSIYLCLKINMEICYILTYFTIISYVLLFSLLILEIFPQKWINFICFILLSISFITKFTQPSLFPYDFYFRNAQSLEMKQKLDLQYQVLTLIGKPEQYTE